MTFDEVMKKVQAEGNENQEMFKDYSSESCVKDLIEIAISDGFITITSEQFLKIYEILGD